MSGGRGVLHNQAVHWAGFAKVNVIRETGRRSGRRPLIDQANMTLIETQPGESLDEFRVAVDDILTHLWDEPRAGWWHPYDVRDTYRIAGVTFRHFSCIAGSVEALLVPACSQWHVPTTGHPARFELRLCPNPCREWHRDPHRPFRPRSGLTADRS